MKLKIPDINLLAIDPGETTGAVGIKQGLIEKVYTITYQEAMEAIASHQEPVQSWRGYKLWVVEDFRTYPWLTTAGFDAVLSARLLGALEVVALQSNIEVVYQMASLTKQFIDDKKLHLLGWWPQLTNGHVRDAARHAAYYLLRQKK